MKECINEDSVIDKIELNTNLIRSIGLEETVLLNYFTQIYEDFEAFDLLWNECGFYVTKDKIKRDCGITHRRQTTICYKLQDEGLLGWLDTYNPFRRIYFLHFGAIEKLIPNK